MDFYDIVRQVLDLLQRDGRTSYRALKRQFNLDDEALEDLKGELLFAHPVTDEAGRGLVWTGEEDLSPESDAQREADAEVRFHAILPVLTMLLQREGQVTYRTLVQVFSLDEVLLNDLREELTLRRLAVDEAGKVLIWTGATQSVTTPAVSVPSQPATPGITAVASPSASTRLPPLTEPGTPSNGPTVPAEAMPTDLPSAEPAGILEPTESVSEAERRQLTVMFCDLADSTKLSQQLDPEDLRDVIRAYQSTAAAVIQQYEGHMAQYLGDGLLVYFGWPRAHEDDAQRALHSGLEIVEAITTTLNPRLEQEKGVQLTVRIGVHTGPVVVGQMGGGSRHENLATGETVNIAARLEGLADSNTVMISSITARLVQRAFALADRGRHALKGVAEPMHALQVLGRVEAHDDEDDIISAGVPFLVGRDEEVGLLMRRWEQSKEGVGQVVLISGEAGIGKSSLVATIRAHVRYEGCTRLTFRCSPYHANSALYPVITHLEHVLGFDREETPEAKLDKLEQVLRMTRLPLAESVPLLATLLSAPLADRYPAPSRSPQQQRQQTLDTLVEWVLEEAGRQPVLAVWEDLHWADPSSLELLGLVLEQTPTVPMLHVLSFRPEFEPPWPMRSHITPMALNRLERPQVEALIEQLAGIKALPVEVVEHIVNKTDGVPLYVEELTKMLLESAFLSAEAGHYRLTGPLQTIAIPDTLQDSLMARLDQLHSAKEVAQLGAVLGREFPYEMLRAISSQDEAALQTGLAQLVEAELLYQRGRLPRSRYLFKHALIQDAAYASLLRSTRQRVHRQVAQLLEVQFPDTAAMQPELLAHHYTEAGQTTDAVRYWRQAGRHASERSSQDEALAHITKGLDLVGLLPQGSARIEQELQLYVTLGSLLMVTKGYAAPEVEDAYMRARELCQQLGNTPQLFTVLAGMAAFYNTRGTQSTARELAQQCLTLAEREQRPTRLVWADSLLGTVLYCLGELVATRQHLEHGISLYSPRMHRAYLPTQDPGVNCLCYVAGALDLLGYPDQALARSETAYELARELAHPFSAVFVRLWITKLHMHRGDIHTAAEQADAMLNLATAQDFNFLGALAIILRGWTRAMQGQVEEGLEQICQGLEAYQATGAGFAQPFHLALLAEAYGQAHQPDTGLRVVADALALVEQQGERFYEAELHRLKGELLLKLSSDNHSTAETCYQQALAVARHQQAKSLELRVATSLARLWQQQGKRQDAYDLLAPMYEWFTEGFDTADLKEAKALLVALSSP